jgi:hypothetical protein
MVVGEPVPASAVPFNSCWATMKSNEAVKNWPKSSERPPRSGRQPGYLKYFDDVATGSSRLLQV